MLGAGHWHHGGQFQSSTRDTSKIEPHPKLRNLDRDRILRLLEKDVDKRITTQEAMIVPEYKRVNLKAAKLSFTNNLGEPEAPSQRAGDMPSVTEVEFVGSPIASTAAGERAGARGGCPLCGTCPNIRT